ncbi:hypothetical protein PTTG_02698 [Puccinia triticina 1-1 BBBD Race 1]|uniref:Secreted protein n=2 Tax=Puccinia triticina TaxID=208348 RepID=A0A180GKG5_PUCT1|nr:uncharacterized protein PtA15_6A650 [Puccinia triticina]OAV92949.1 hypothetical protein PTTG_02698 [Puccinia triticina 1-1 BBBD Race 1]WAQ86020.1 hypothetical protein PtA15_6A650 [Puccinia triticina]WAR55915.1 hypothetical protein PtB15_6B659 [Puccinia triticina]
MLRFFALVFALMALCGVSTARPTSLPDLTKINMDHLTTIGGPELNEYSQDLTDDMPDVVANRDGSSHNHHHPSQHGSVHKVNHGEKYSSLEVAGAPVVINDIGLPAPHLEAHVDYRLPISIE